MKFFTLQNSLICPNNVPRYEIIQELDQSEYDRVSDICSDISCTKSLILFLKQSTLSRLILFKVKNNSEQFQNEGLNPPVGKWRC